MERPIKKHQNIVPLTNEEIALQNQLLRLAGGRGVGRQVIQQKPLIATILVELDPVRMYYITDRDFSHKLARYNEDLQELWLNVATMWWDKYSTSVGLEEIIEKLKNINPIDYYRLILCNWLLQKTFKNLDLRDRVLYMNDVPAATLKTHEDLDESTLFRLVAPPKSLDIDPKLTLAFDAIVVPDFRKPTYVIPRERRGMAKTRLTSFVFLYKLLSIEGLWIEIELEKTAQQHFEDPEKLKTYKTILVKYRSEMQETDKKRKQWVDLYNFRILDHRLVSCDEMINELEKNGFLSVTSHRDKNPRKIVPIFISTTDLKFKMVCNYRENLLDQIVLHFFGILPHPDRSEYEFDVPTFEQQVIIFYILLSNGYTYTDYNDKKYLVREKINDTF